MQQRKIGISVLCFGLIAAFRGPQNILQRAVEAGANGLQLLPLWFWTKASLKKLPQGSILSFEDAWNQGGFWKNTLCNIDRLKRDTHFGIPLSPLFDLGLFAGICNIPSGKVSFFKSCFPAAVAIDTGCAEDAVEVQPEGNLHLSAKSVVFDTFHALERCNWNVKQSIVLASSLSEKIVCIHFQIRSREQAQGMLSDFFDGVGYLHDVMTVLGQSSQSVPIIIEVSEGELRKIGHSMSELIERLRSY